MSYFEPQSNDNYYDTNKENTLNKQTNPLPIKDNQYISGPHQPPQPPYLPPPYTQPPYLPPQPPQPTYYQPPPPQPPQPPPSLPPYFPPPRPIVVTIGPAVFPLPSCACRFCGREHVLIASKKIGQGALIVFFLLLLICWPLCWLPFVIDDCKDKCYSCSQCGQELSHLNYSLF